MITESGKDGWRTALVIVAHPDDEIIWCGGLMLQNPDWDWSVLSLSRKNDPDRCPKFHRVCDILGAKAFISDLDDSSPLKPINWRREIARRVIECLDRHDWDLLITHGSNGEYGHQRHQEVHAEVLSLIGRGVLGCGELWTFAYDCDAGTKTCKVDPHADMIVELSDAHLHEKRRIIQEVYGYGCNSFEVSACISPEAFDHGELPQE
jgi:hypothetical protein